ncbi:DUF2254 domain-containing protein [Marixanthomonas spongiae]|uniref:DUF2254 domain-containing protein n=1 Tax=Marixanthomonas spongiae TaxID=2174845 RepID=A0A2U0HXA7_9FLAO|nr:DUF2254 domain-containing protein [Marixanthomonas spongiae]PVW13494.1 DUF2254 domain-containing protein [Marixanthomonas spongiae]
MKQFLVRIHTFYSTLKSKIAFYPSLIALFGFVIALIMVIAEQKGISRHLIEVFPLLVVEDGDTALSVLSTCIGGLISLMVFSFSMVMLLLSQASSNFSPRLLPGLISNKRHQIILGVYLGTIIYNIFTLFSVETSEEKFTLPGFSILLGVVFSIICLGAFIFFIHNISQSIQINNIMDGIYDQATHRLNSIIEREDEKKDQIIQAFPKTENWYSYTSPKSGYFQNIATQNIIDICKRKEMKLYITVPKGLFVLKNIRVLKANKKLDEDTVQAIFANLNFARGEYIQDNYALAFKQITEIAVRAMSPGVNDPGTAINAIDYLTELFALRMKKNDLGVFSEEGNPYIKIAVVHFHELLYQVMASLRTYCRHDPTVAQKLIWMLGYLKQQPSLEQAYMEAIDEELKVLLKAISFDSEKDMEKVQQLADSILKS